METFAWGAFGALAPEIVRWYRIARTETPAEWTRWSYWAATGSYVCLAGAFAGMVAQPSAYAAFAAGVTTEFAIVGLLGSPGGTGIEELNTRPATPLRIALAALRSHAAYLSSNG
jgi:predicted lysophospholipase L1 biosynthesis ABC-type transport system permease subunit